MKWSRSKIVVDGIKLQGAAARQVTREANRLVKLKRNRRDRITQVVMFACLCMMSMGIMYPSIWLHKTYGVVPTLIFQAVAGGAIGTTYAIWWQRTHRREIRQAMRVLGYELCGSCGYWLRGLGDGVKHCPECGAQRVPMMKEPAS